MSVTLRRYGLCLALFAMLSSGISAQSLARRGWAGSGLSVENWWQSAILYQVDPLTFRNTDGNGLLRDLTQHLDYLQTLGIDALVLSPFPLETRPASTQPFDPVYGTEEDLASLIQEASRRKIRILVDLPFNNTLSGDQTANAARFWLSRGIAGLRLVNPANSLPDLTPAQTATRLADLERLSASYPGQRILFWDLSTPFMNPSPVTVSPRRSTHSRSARPQPVPPPSNLTGPQLVLDSRLLNLNYWVPGDLRSLLATRPSTSSSPAAPVFESDGIDKPRSFDRFSDGTHSLDIARQTAALLLLSPAVPQLYFGQELGSSSSSVALEDPDESSLLNWYRRLSTLRHGNTALRSGSLNLLPLPEPDIVAWVRRAPAAATLASPVVVVCNLSSRAIVVSLSTGLRALGISTSSNLLRTLAFSSNSASAATPSVSSLALPAYSVYVGELRAETGLESAPAPTRHRSGRSSAR